MPRQENKQKESVQEMITKEMNIGYIVSEYPEVVPILQEYGIHCVGCHVSAFETLGEGLMAHGLSDGDVETVIKDLNKVVLKKRKELSKLKEKVKGGKVFLTDAAAKKIHQVLEQQNKKDYCLRVRVLPGGCSGHVYWLGLEDKVSDSDIVVEAEGVKMVVDPESMVYLNGTTIDYVETLNEQGFKFNNPNASRECGCGKSFR